MAARTLRTKYETFDGLVSRNCSIFCHAKNVKEIYYQYDDEIEAPASDAVVDVPIAATPATPVTPVISSTPASTLSSGPVASMDVSVTCHSCCGKVFKGALPVTFYTNAKE